MCVQRLHIMLTRTCVCAHVQVTHAPVCSCCGGVCVCTRVGSVSPVSPAAPGSGCLWCQGTLRAGWEDAAKVKGVSVPNGSFSSQENSDVFLSTVDTDWKVGPATGGAAHPGLHMEQQPVPGEGCGALSGLRDFAVPFLMGMQCLVNVCWGCTSIMVPVRRGQGDAARHLCAGARLWLVGTWPWAGTNPLKQAISSQEG